MDKQEYAKQQDSLQQQIEEIAQAGKEEEPQFFDPAPVLSVMQDTS